MIWIGFMGQSHNVQWFFALFWRARNGDCSRRCCGHQTMKARSAAPTASPPKTSRARVVFRGLFRGLACWPPLFFPTQKDWQNHWLSWHCRFKHYRKTEIKNAQQKSRGFRCLRRPDLKLGTHIELGHWTFRDGREGMRMITPRTLKMLQVRANRMCMHISFFVLKTVREISAFFFSMTTVSGGWSVAPRRKCVCRAALGLKKICTRRSPWYPRKKGG